MKRTFLPCKTIWSDWFPSHQSHYFNGILEDFMRKCSMLKTWKQLKQCKINSWNFIQIFVVGSDLIRFKIWSPPDYPGELTELSQSNKSPSVDLDFRGIWSWKSLSVTHPGAFVFLCLYLPPPRENSQLCSTNFTISLVGQGFYPWSNLMTMMCIELTSQKQIFQKSLVPHTYRKAHPSRR